MGRPHEGGGTADEGDLRLGLAISTEWRFDREGGILELGASLVNLNLGLESGFGARRTDHFWIFFSGATHKLRVVLIACI